MILSLLLALQAFPEVPVVIDSAAARQLGEHWQRTPGDSLACLYGSTEKGIIVIDSAPRLAIACGGPGVIGMVGFIKDPHWNEAEVVAQMARVLAVRTDLYIVGEVHAVMPIALVDGRWIKAPRVWGAARAP